VQHAHEVDDRIAASNQLIEQTGRKHVGLDDLDRGKQDEMLCAFAAARRHGHPRPARGKRRHEMPTEKAAAAEDEEVLFTHDRKLNA
jgi:hypothetical protein